MDCVLASSCQNPSIFPSLGGLEGYFERELAWDDGKDSEVLVTALFGLPPGGDCAPLSPRTLPVLNSFPWACLQCVAGLVYAWQVLSGEVKDTAELPPLHVYCSFMWTLIYTAAFPSGSAFTSILFLLKGIVITCSLEQNSAEVWRATKHESEWLF